MTRRPWNTRLSERASDAIYHCLGDEHVCAYCGDPADTFDHTVPSSFVSGNIDLISRCKLYKVPACGECNHIAWNVVDRSFIARKRRIARKVRKRHATLLGAAEWGEDEKATLGRTLRDFVDSSMRARAHVLLRLQTLESDAMPPGMPLFFFSQIQNPTEAPGGPSEAQDGELGSGGG
jgi:hypothetical protein